MRRGSVSVGAGRQCAPAALLGLLGTACILALPALTGCVDRAPLRPVLSSRFYGIWANANPRLQNWIVITREGAVPYSLAADGKCSQYRSETLGPNELKANDATVHLRLAEDLLLMVSDDWQTIALFKRTDPNATCQRPDDTHPKAVATTAARPVLASRFYGIWANANPRGPNWMLISKAGLVPYGITTDGKCETYHAITLAPKEFQAPQTTVHIRRAEDLLLMVSDDWQVVSTWKQADASAVCQKSDGSYAEGGPSIGRSR